MKRRLASFGSALVLSLSSLLTLSMPRALAAADTCTWTGAGSDAKFSTAANWTGCDNGNVPEAGDTLAFPALGTQQAPINDTTLSYAGIQFTGATSTCSSAPYNPYNITGTQPLSIGGTISNNFTGNCTTVLLNLSIIATAGVSIVANSGIDVGTPNTTSTLSLGSNTLSVSGTGFVNLYNKISGSGSITSSTYLNLNGDNSGYSGTITQSAKGLSIYKTGLGGGSAVSNDGSDISVDICDGATLSNNLTLNGLSSSPTGDYPTPKLSVYYTPCPPPSGGGGGCTGCPTYDEYYGASSAATAGSITYSGTLTLGNDATLSTNAKTLTVTGPVTGNKKLTLVPGSSGNLVLNSSANGSATPNGTYNPKPITKTLSDDLPTKTVNLAGNYELTIDGKRSDVVVQDGAKLLGTGTIGKLTVDATSKVAPGHSPGCLNTGDVTLSGSLDEEIGGPTACSEYDQLKVTGTVNVTGATLNTILYNGFKPVAGQNYTVISNDGSDAVTGTFNNLPEGAAFTVSGYVLKITYKGGDGNDVVLSVQSVPTTPNTGFSLISSSPLQSFLTVSTLAGAIALIAKRYSKLGLK